MSVLTARSKVKIAENIKIEMYSLFIRFLSNILSNENQISLEWDVDFQTQAMTYLIWK